MVEGNKGRKDPKARGKEPDRGWPEIDRAVRKPGWRLRSGRATATSDGTLPICSSPLPRPSTVFQVNSSDTTHVAWLRILDYAVASPLRLCRSGPFRFSPHGSAMRLITPPNRYRKALVVSACHHPLHTPSVLLGPPSVYNVSVRSRI